MEEYLKLVKKFNDTKDMCTWFQLVAYDTWRRIGFARTHHGLKIFETTITQNILYEFAVYKSLYGLKLNMYEAINENANGNDIEFEFIANGRLIKLPMQAKIIYGNGKYPRMEHGAQIESLIDYADKNDGLPLYLLYNYYPHASPGKFKEKTDCGISYGLHQYGITVVSAYHLHRKYYNARTDATGKLRWSIPRFNDLHPLPGIPWFKLVCCLKQMKTTEEIGEFLDAKMPESDLKFKFQIPTVFDAENPIGWKSLDLQGLMDMREEAQLYSKYRGNDMEESTGAKEYKRQISFDPKYRIQINLDQ